MMIRMLPVYMAVSLGCTLILECSAAAALRVKNKKDFLNIVLVNVLTNPLVVTMTFSAGVFFGREIRVVSIVIMELFAFLSEALIYRKTLEYKRINPFLLSLILNGTSYFLGLILNKIIY
ncbi:MAG: hypothetical protein IJB86_06095 [Clostridia bacterium]|nr:hypothetical protein [Clostridia bacterium]